MLYKTEVVNKAEKEILRYKADVGKWFLHCTNVVLHPIQLAMVKEYIKYNTTITVAAMRLGKTFAGMMFNLYWAATNPGENVRLFSPSSDQTKENLRDIAKVVIQSDLLKAYVDNSLDRGINTERIRFKNFSDIIMRPIESAQGTNATVIDIDEFDDLDPKIVQENVFSRGARITNSRRSSKINVRGIIRGKRNLAALEDTGEFYCLPKFNAMDGVEQGILSADFIKLQMKLLSKEQFDRLYLCKYTEANRYYPTKLILACSFPNIKGTIPPDNVANVIKEKDKLPEFKGKVVFGLDTGRRGSVGSKKGGAGRTAITFLEIRENNVYWLFSREWEADTSSTDRENDIIDLCKYFRPCRGQGDAFDITLIENINKTANKEGITHLNTSTTNEEDWFIKPITFSGALKHQFHSRLKSKMERSNLLFPIKHWGKGYDMLEKLKMQLESVERKPTSFKYDSYNVLDDVLGDDLMDSLLAAIDIGWEENVDVSSLTMPLIWSANYYRQQNYLK